VEVEEEEGKEEDFPISKPMPTRELNLTFSP
jgi:hypothetical protein